MQQAPLPAADLDDEVVPREGVPANQLASEQRYPQAAEAYETFLKAYPKYEQTDQLELMLGLIYARYLNQFPRAHQCLVRALAKLHGEREIAMAKGELTRIEIEMAGKQL